MNARWLHFRAVATLLVVWCMSGCAGPSNAMGLEQRSELRRRALVTLTTAATHESAAVRVRAVEALQSAAAREGQSYFRELLSDPYPGVRFASLMAIGTLVQKQSQSAVRGCLSDPDPSVRVAALFAMHRLGDARRTSELATMLLNSPIAGVRGNAAIVLGRLGDPGAIKVLELARSDRDESVRLQALEAMLLLGSDSARRDLRAIAMGGAGQRTVFALLALSEARRPDLADLFEYDLQHGVYDEVRLAAAVGLGRLGRSDGFDLAMERLKRFSPRAGNNADPPAQQAERIKMLATTVLEAVGDPAALPVLQDMLARDTDDSVRVCTARAVLVILQREPVS